MCPEMLDKIAGDYLNPETGDYLNPNDIKLLTNTFR